ncbi:splicing factor subunit [Cyclospora cayetanensis]|uniref:Splicing factor subunit n=1 Tax=Cyclospora cayetanensis TaxID=88456 RepID=A0A1D3D948_9EIME|nr:splicing factor subunit [Cyclospora cayetanensis]
MEKYETLVWLAVGGIIMFFLRSFCCRWGGFQTDGSVFLLVAERVMLLQVGLNTGVMIRSSIDPVTGSLSDQRTRFLGGRAARFHLVRMGNKMAVMGLSEKSWLSFFFQGRFQCAPLHYDPLECIASFSSEQVCVGDCPLATTLKSDLLGLETRAKQDFRRRSGGRELPS